MTITVWADWVALVSFLNGVNLLMIRSRLCLLQQTIRPQRDEARQLSCQITIFFVNETSHLLCLYLLLWDLHFLCQSS